MDSGRTRRTRRPSQFAVIPVAYAGEYSRCLGNRSCGLIYGRFAPVVGRECADNVRADATDIARVEIGGEVVPKTGSGEQQVEPERRAFPGQTVDCGFLTRLLSESPGSAA